MAQVGRRWSGLSAKVRFATAVIAATVLGAAIAWAWVGTLTVSAPSALNVNGSSSFEASATLASGVYAREAVFTFPKNTSVASATIVSATLGGAAISPTPSVVTSGSVVTVTMSEKSNANAVLRIRLGGIVNASQPGHYSYSVDFYDSGSRTGALNAPIANAYGYDLAANASAPTIGTVALSHSFISQGATYTIPVVLGSAGRIAGDTAAGPNTVRVKFPVGVTVPASPAAGDVLINGSAATTVTVAGQAVTVSVPAGVTVASGAAASLVFKGSFGLVNPSLTGTYSIEASTSAETGSGSSSFAIRKPITASIASASDKVYDGSNAASVSVTASGIDPGDSIGFAWTSALFDSKNVGTGKAVTVSGITLTGADANKYELTSPYATSTASITAAALSITASDASKTYGNVKTFAGTEFSQVGLKPGDAIAAVALDSGGAAATSSVGTYTVDASNASGSGLSNYDVTYHAGVLSVSPRALAVTANSTHKTYGAELDFLGTEFGTSGLTNGDAISAVTLASDGAPAASDVGTYAIGVSDAVFSTGSASNYAIAYRAGVLTVDTASLVITAHDLTKTFGDDVVYAGTEFDAVGLRGTDGIADVTLASAGDAATSHVGTYTVVPSAAVFSSGSESNYAISYAVGTLTVEAKDLTVTAWDSGKTYGDSVTFTGTEFDVDGLANSDTASSVTCASDGATSTAGVGTYDITPSALVLSSGAATDYSITYLPGTLTVDAKPADITADDASKTYGDAHPFAGTEFTVEGLVNGDAVASVTLTSAGATRTAGVGDYAILASAPQMSSGSASNYDFSYYDGNLAVDPRDLTVTADDSDKTYGDSLTFAGTEFSADGLVNADTIDKVTLVSSGATATAVVGEYDVTASSAHFSRGSAGNYSIYYASGLLTVGLRPLTLTATNYQKLVGTAYTFTGTEFTATGLANADAVTAVALDSEGATASAALGDYDITIDNATGTGLSNYEIGYVWGVLRVRSGAARVTLNALSYNPVYGASAQVSAGVSTSQGQPMQGAAVTVQTSLDGVTWSAAAPMAESLLTTGTYTAAVAPRAASGVTYLRIVSADDGVNGEGVATATILPQAGFTTPKVTRVSNHYRYVSGSVSPAHAAKIYFEIQRYSSSKRKWIGVSKTSYTTGSSGTLKVKKYFSSRGWMRVRITHADAGHAFGTSAWAKVWIN